MVRQGVVEQGRSRHGQPVRNIQRIAPTTSSSAARGRPSLRRFFQYLDVYGNYTLAEPGNFSLTCPIDHCPPSYHLPISLFKHSLDKPGSEGQGQAVELVMKKTEITYTPDLLHAVRPDKLAAYTERLKSLIGKDIPEIQAWHVFATIEGGQLARMIVRECVPFASNLDEAYYRRDEIDQLSTWDPAAWKPKSAEKQRK